MLIAARISCAKEITRRTGTRTWTGRKREPVDVYIPLRTKSYAQERIEIHQKMTSSELISLEFQFPITPPTPWYPWKEQLRMRTFTTSFECGVLRTWSASPCHCGCACPCVMPGARKKKKHLTERRWFFQKTRWCEDSKKFQSMLCSQKLAPSMHQAVSWLTIDTSSVRPLFSLQPRLFPLSGQHISPLPVVPTSEQTQVEDAWLECLHNPIIHHFLMAKLSRNSLKIWMLQQAPQGSVFLGSTSNPSCFPIPFPCFSEVFKTTCWQCFSKHNDGSAWAVDGDHSGENAIGPWHFWHDQQLIPENGVLAMWCHVYLQRLGTRRASSKKHNNNDDNNDKHASFGKKTSPNSFSFGHGGRRMILHESLG